MVKHTDTHLDIYRRSLHSKERLKTYSEEISIDTIPEDPTKYTYSDFLQKLQNLVDELQHEDDQKKENEGGGGADDPDGEGKNNNGENGGSGDNSDAKSALALFDKLQAKED